jgi:hypothetical protein
MEPTVGCVSLDLAEFVKRPQAELQIGAARILSEAGRLRQLGRSALRR